MAKYATDKYQITNVKKYVGKHAPTYRSSWEHTFMRFCDFNDSIINWASEPFAIPYRNPFTGKNTVYIPDFLVVYIDANQQKHAEMIEIKPTKETTMEYARSARDKAAAALNHAKWTAAAAWCKQQGLGFRIVTETDIYAGVKKPKPKKKK